MNMFRPRSKILAPAPKSTTPVAEVRTGAPTTPPNDDSPPPSYAASTAVDAAPNITAAFADLKLTPEYLTAQTPSSDQCLAHLKLLEAFHSLREDISQHDGLFGIDDNFAATSDTVVLTKIREKRWQVYVSKAAKRFEAWWMTCVMPNATRQSIHAVADTPQSLWEGSTLSFARSNLPPLGKHCGRPKSL